MSSSAHNRTAGPVSFLLAVLLVACVPSAAAESYPDGLLRTRVAYAGLALMGRADDAAANYAYLTRLQDEAQQHFYQSLSAIQPAHYDLVTDALLDSDAGHTLSLALVFDHEKVSLEQVAGVHKALVDVSAQLMVYDFDGNTGAVIASYPVALPPYIETFSRPPSAAQLERLVRGYVFGGLDEHPGMLERAAELARAAPIKQRYAGTIGIGDVLVAEAVTPHLPPRLEDDPDNVRFVLGRQLAARLTARQRVSIIPARVDSSIASMAMRFAGQRRLTFLELPEPDYLLDLALLDLTKNPYRSSAAGTSFLYGAYVQFRVRQRRAAGDEEHFNQILRQGMTKPVPATQTRVDDWAAMEASIHTLFERFSREIDQPSSDWAKVQELGRADLQQFEQLRDILDQCR